jgi:hypothetical protein
MTAPGFAKILDPDGTSFADTDPGPGPDPDSYKYPPHLICFGNPLYKSDDLFTLALTEPIVSGYTVSPYPVPDPVTGNANPLTVRLSIFNAENITNASDIMLYAEKYDTASYVKVDPGKITVGGNSFQSDLGNNKSKDFYFFVSLSDKYGREAMIIPYWNMLSSNGNMNTIFTVERKLKIMKDIHPIPMPFIDAGSLNVTFGQNGKRQAEKLLEKSDISGFSDNLPESDSAVVFDEHWFGNGHHPQPTPTPTPVVTYSATFSASVKNTDMLSVFDIDDGMKLIGSTPVANTSGIMKSPDIVVKRDNTPYSFNHVRFVASQNSSGITATADWSRQSGNELSPEKTTLKQLTWSLTGKCNLHCKHCSARDIQKDMNDMTWQEIKDATRQIIDLGVPNVTLSGGEVLVSPYWREVADSQSQNQQDFAQKPGFAPFPAVRDNVGGEDPCQKGGVGWSEND